MNKCLNFYILEILRLKRRNKLKTVTTDKQCFVLGCRLSGESTFFFGEKTITVKRGDILYIPAGSSYTQICNENEELVCFHLDVFGSAPKELLVFTPDKPDEFCSLFKKAYKIWSDKNKNYAYSCMAILYYIVSKCNFPEYTEKAHSIIKNSVDYIDAHLSDAGLSLSEALKESNISRAYFNRVFIKEYGITPVKYIQKRRIEKAMLLIGSGDYTREEIATLCGFKDTKYFYTVFKKVSGMTTKEYSHRTIKNQP